MVRFAIFGAGRIGRMHAETLSRHPQTQLRYVYDVHAESAQSLADQYGARAVDNVAAALADEQLDAVLIASSTDTHVTLLEQAARAGKAVICEKPIDMSLERVEACRALLSTLDVPVQIGFNRRFDPNHQSLCQAVHQGEIGNLEQLIITSRDPGLPPLEYLKVSGGIFFDMMIHDFDMARCILQENPVEIVAHGSAIIDPEVALVPDVDSAMVVMKTASGRLCHINVSRRATYGYDQRIEALGSQGMLISGNPLRTTVQRYDARATGSGTPLMNFFMDRYEQAFRLQVSAFVEALQAGRRPSPSFEDGYQAQRLAKAALESLQTGSVVRLD